MAINYDSVLNQLRGHGLLVDAFEADGKTHRCKIEGSRDKPGWYLLREITLERGDKAIVGAFGVWRGTDNGSTKVDMKLPDLTPEQKKAIRDQMRADQKRVEAQRAGEAARASKRARAMWSKLSDHGECDYLPRKGVAGHGVRYTPTGAMAVPMMDNAGQVWGLQFILGGKSHANRIQRIGRDKEYWPKGHIKRGHYHLIGLPIWLCLVAEGYATAASLHEATGLPVAVAFDAGNIGPVVEQLRDRFRSVKFIVCADDDQFGGCQFRDAAGKRCNHPIDLSDNSPTCPSCGNEHKVGNAGTTSAATAAMACADRVQWIKPKFADPDARRAAFFDNGGKLSDFNDLHATDGLAAVRDQVEAALRQFGWAPPARTPRAIETEGGGDSSGRRGAVSMLGLDDIVDRFIHIDDNTGDFVFDTWTKCVVKRTKVVAMLPPRIRWDHVKDHPVWNTRAVYIDQIGFDPAGEDANILCNRWDGWPTKPAEGSCERLLELLGYLCSAEQNGAEVYEWVLRWLAYPIQHPGAKLHSAIVVHGPQGTGKSRFFESYARIYGDYSLVLNQGAIEDKFNADWTERKLFIVADEIVARSDMYHLKNQLKGFITGEWVRVNPKNVAAHRERNHMNLVFLSNEKQPVVLENDDRRHLVIWTPPALSRDYFDEIDAEINAGGIAALHSYLLQIPLGDFKPWTRPPMTRSKQQLIDINRESVDRFLSDWQSGDIDGLPFCPCGSSDLYAAYLQWCRREGVKVPRESNQFGGHLDKLQGWQKGHRDRYTTCHYDGGTKRQRMVIPPDEAMRTPPWNAKGPDGYAKPLNKSQTQWLTDSYFAFNVAVTGGQP
ncbi:DUF5906 domain-containing protein [Denitromonas halophila]|uniref:Toprim domain-containing protein n=1 Tax=Denitromonas halophila TaxID=1629404 RepID=A0A557QLQ1_9RHOO|nr:DUF5906 domain-containing protein [Denitromonas halophila]TVO53835.1 toprim domain-containing protein [Denitromonas halophila]